MLEEQLVSFETAKLAKAKGFNKLCFYYYNKIGELIEPEENWSNTIVEFTVDLTDLLDNYNNKYQENYSAPTQSLLQKWLREEYDIHIAVTPFILNNKNRYYAILYYDDPENSGNDEDFNTYEEALEEGLQEALKLLKL